MVRHVILWKLKDMPEAEKTAVKAGIKAGLEGLAGQIPGLLEVHVYTDALPSSANADLMLDTTFTDEAALKGYAVHPAHVAVADGKVRPYTAVRTCLDFTVEEIKFDRRGGFHIRPWSGKSSAGGYRIRPCGVTEANYANKNHPDPRRSDAGRGTPRTPQGRSAAGGRQNCRHW